MIRWRRQAMQTLAQLSARRVSRLARLFWAALTALLGFVVSVAAWNLSPDCWRCTRRWAGLRWVFCSVDPTALGLALREWAGYARLARLDRIRAIPSGPGRWRFGRRAQDRHELTRLYNNRPALAVARRTEHRMGETLTKLCSSWPSRPFWRRWIAARRKSYLCRQVAMITLVPLALADVVMALTAICG